MNHFNLKKGGTHGWMDGFPSVSVNVDRAM